MNSKDVNIYIERYNSRLDRFGYSPESLGWGGGRERQMLRFRILSEIGVGVSDSVLDIGCGFGDLYEYLTQTGWHGRYVGVDLNEKLLEVARKVHKGITVKQLDILNTKEEMECDWALCSGVFNAKLSYEDNFVYIKKMIRRMLDVSAKGVGVDFMSTYVDFQNPEAYHTSPSSMVEFCKKELDAKFILRMDYLPYEFAIYLKK